MVKIEVIIILLPVLSTRNIIILLPVLSNTCGQYSISINIIYKNIFKKNVKINFLSNFF